jgi:hypothetical protein
MGFSVIFSYTLFLEPTTLMKHINGFVLFVVLCMKYGHGIRRADLILQKAGKVIKDLNIPVKPSVLRDRNGDVTYAAVRHVDSCYHKVQTSTPKCGRNVSV